MARRKVLKISNQVLLDFFTASIHKAYEIVRDAVPQGAEIVGIRLQTFRPGSDVIEILLESESFEDILAGNAYPDIYPLSKTLENSPHDT